MLHEQIREARIQAGLTQVKLARMAGVPRSQLRKFEEGGNITLTTLRKIVEQLPDLPPLELGAVQIRAGGVDPAVVHEMARQLMAMAKQLLSLIGASAPAEAPPETKPEPEPDEKREPKYNEGPVGATRFEGGRHVSAKMKAYLNAINPVSEENLALREAAEKSGKEH